MCQPEQGCTGNRGRAALVDDHVFMRCPSQPVGMMDRVMMVLIV